MDDQLTLTTTFMGWDDEDSLWSVEADGYTYTINAHNGASATMMVADALGYSVDIPGVPSLVPDTFTYTATKE